MIIEINLIYLRTNWKFIFKMKRYSIILTTYDYNTLLNNSMILMWCERQLKSAKIYEDEVKMKLTLRELEDLTGITAAESNHTKTRKEQEELSDICDDLESYVYDIKSQV